MHSLGIKPINLYIAIAPCSSIWATRAMLNIILMINNSYVCIFICFRRFNLNRSVTYYDVTDDALDDMIKDIVAGNDQLGSEAVRAHLRAGGVRVQRDRVRKILIRTNPRAAALRAMAQRRPHRRLYSVAGPNSLWHLDGNHKLIR